MSLSLGPNASRNDSSTGNSSELNALGAGNLREGNNKWEKLEFDDFQGFLGFMGLGGMREKREGGVWIWKDCIFVKLQTRGFGV